MNATGIKIAVVALIVVVLFLGFTASSLMRSKAFRADLTGREEAPPANTNVRGMISFHVGPGDKEMTYLLSITNIDGTTWIRIHEGEKGREGPLVLDLSPNLRKGVELDEVISEGTITADDLQGPLKGKPLDSLIQLMKANNAYVNVGSLKHPRGEIRGQIRWMTWARRP